MVEGDYAELYRDEAGEFRTRIRSANHELIFDSGEGYENAVDALNMLATRFPEIVIHDVSESD